MIPVLTILRRAYASEPSRGVTPRHSLRHRISDVHRRNGTGNITAVRYMTYQWLLFYVLLFPLPIEETAARQAG